MPFLTVPRLDTPSTRVQPCAAVFTASSFLGPQSTGTDHRSAVNSLQGLLRVQFQLRGLNVYLRRNISPLLTRCHDEEINGCYYSLIMCLGSVRSRWDGRRSAS